MFGPFFVKSAENSTADFFGRQIFLGPLCRFAAEISAPWQHLLSCGVGSHPPFFNFAQMPLEAY
jgi:hypothetical protein